MNAFTSTTLAELLVMSRELGRPEHGLAIFGEGNTSAREGEERFWVKASGACLQTLDAAGVALLDRAETVALLDRPLAGDEDILAALLDANCAETGGRRPSIEAMMHAFLLGLPEVNFVGHTHPVSVNALLCSAKAEHLVSLACFPDQIVCCGPAPVFVPYCDPGMSLAHAVRKRVNAWMDERQMVPRAVMLQNHGLFALGKTPQNVLSCTLMWAKTAQVITGAMACGGVNPLTASQVERIFTRPDERFREKMIGGEIDE